MNSIATGIYDTHLRDLAHGGPALEEVVRRSGHRPDLLAKAYLSQGSFRDDVTGDGDLAERALVELREVIDRHHRRVLHPVYAELFGYPVGKGAGASLSDLDDPAFMQRMIGYIESKSLAHNQLVLANNMAALVDFYGLGTSRKSVAEIAASHGVSEQVARNRVDSGKHGLKRGSPDALGVLVDLYQDRAWAALTDGTQVLPTSHLRSRSNDDLPGLFQLAVHCTGFSWASNYANAFPGGLLAPGVDIDIMQEAASELPSFMEGVVDPVPMDDLAANMGVPSAYLSRAARLSGEFQTHGGYLYAGAVDPTVARAIDLADIAAEMGGDPNLQELFAAYRAGHPGDPAATEDLMTAMMEFPGLFPTTEASGPRP